MAVAQGVRKVLAIGKQSALGTALASPGASAQLYRRTSSTIDLNKDTYKSNEIKTSMQHSDLRHGLRSVSGTISGELSPKTYQKLFESVLRGTAASVSALSSLTITAAVVTVGTGKATMTSGSSWSSTLKDGMVVQFTGFSGGQASNNSRNFLITDVTTTVITGQYLDGVDAVAGSTSASAGGVTIPGKNLQITSTATSFTPDYWTIEHWFPDISQSEVFTDCVFSQASVKLPSTGMATVDFGVMGLNMSKYTSQQLSSASAQSTTGICAAVNGVLYVNGVAYGTITGADITINGNIQAEGAVVGSNVAPDLNRGSIEVTGSLTGLFDGVVLRDLFINETSVAVAIALTSGSASTGDFISFYMPAVKLTSASKDDGEKGITQTFNFTALEYTGADASTVASTIMIHDSQFA